MDAETIRAEFEKELVPLGLKELEINVPIREHVIYTMAYYPQIAWTYGKTKLIRRGVQYAIPLYENSDFVMEMVRAMIDSTKRRIKKPYKKYMNKL